MDLVEQVHRTLQRYGMPEAGRRIGVAVSGGADSVCLLHVLRELAAATGWRLSVVHVNHRLRGRESQADEAFVCEAAQRLGLPFFVCHAGAAGAGNLEQAARRTRLHFFRRLIEEGTLDRIADGHTRSDQAETVLFRFLRGAGTAGLAAIRPVTGWGLVRPLLETGRSEVEAFLRERRIQWREDSSNRDVRFARNRIRRDLLPQLARDWNPAIVDTLAATADWARGEEEYWGIEVERLSADLFVRYQGTILVRTTGLTALREAAMRRLIRYAVQQVKGDLRGVDFAHIQRIKELIAATRGSGRVQMAGVSVERSFDWVRFALFPRATTGGFSEAVTVPGEVHGIVMELLESRETSEHSCNVYNGEAGCLDWRRLSGSLTLRSWQAGDRYQPLGSSGVERIKTLFQNARIPIWERRDWPVLTDGETIVWARQFGPAAEFAAKSGCAAILLVRDANRQNRIAIRQGGVY